MWEKNFRTIEGKTIKRKTGLAAIRHDGTGAGIEVVFGEGDDAEVLGVTALEGLGMEVDPVTKQLKRTSLLAL
jgi:predicted aspartyl protease